MAERLASEEYSIIATIDPDEYAASTIATDVWNMKNFSKVMAIIMRGATTTSSTLDAKLKFAATSNGSYTTLSSGKYITQMTGVAADGDLQAIINLSAAEAAATTCEWVKLHMTIGTTKNDAAAIVLGKPVRTLAFTTIAANDLSTVDEIVA